MDQLPSLESLLGDDCASALANNSLVTQQDNFGSDDRLPLLPTYNGDSFPCNLTDELLTAILANFSHAAKYKYPEYYSTNYRIVGTLFQSVIFVVGVLGNVLVVLVVHRTSSMHTPTNCYLVSLAVADCIVLITSVPDRIIGYYLVGDEWIWGRVGCAISVFLQYAGINASSLSITAFTIERYIAICHPMKAQTVCTVQRAKRIIGAVWAFAICYCSPWLLLTKTEPLMYIGLPLKEVCTFALSRTSYLGYYFADLVMFYVIPLLLSCVLYGLIARILFTTNIAKTPGNPHLHYPNPHNHHANGFHSAHTARPPAPASSARVQVVKMLVAVVSLFAILWMPYRVWVVYNSFASEPYMDLWFNMFAKTMVFINSAINPILYNAMSVKFRRAFRRMLSCGKRSALPRYSSVALHHSCTVTSTMRNSSWRHHP